MLGPTIPSFPGYEVEALIGEGGMGQVFRARDRSLHRFVALKVIYRTGPGDLARFLAEAEATAAVDHPNVVRVYAYGEVGGRAYLVEELCGGGTLADRLRSGPVPPQEAAALIVQICRGVAAVHTQGIVHRDLKPSNVLFDTGGVPKVADFGVAKRAASDLTQTQSVMGTPVYMSPEQARGHAKSAGPAVDVWALGVILYECLTGHRPFDDPESWIVRHKVLHHRPLSPRSIVPSVPRDLERICLKCLTKSPGGRYPTARELADDLGRFLEMPVEDEPRSPARRLYQHLRRHPVLTAAMILTLTGAVWGIVSATRWMLDRLPAQDSKADSDADRVAAGIEGPSVPNADALFGAPPSVEVDRGRTLLQQTEDEYRTGNGTFLDRERLDRAEHLLRAATGRQDVDPGLLAEAHYQLGRAALLRYKAESSESEKSKLFREAAAALAAAAEAAGRLDEDPWTEAILRAAYDAAEGQRARQADRQLRPVEAEATAKALDQLADRKGPRAATPVWRAALKVRAVRLREGVRPKAEDWFQKVRDAAEEAVAAPGGRDREADLRAELLVALAEGRSARAKHRKHYDPRKAAEFAREAVKLTEARADLPAGLRADALGALGLALYRGEPDGRAEARSSLEKALAALAASGPPEGGAGPPPGWRWRYALGYLDVLDAAAAKQDVAAADLAVRAMNRFLPMRVPLFRLKSAADPDPDDKALADEFFNSEANMYKACGTYWQKAIAAHADDPRRFTWRLAAAEVDWLLASDRPAAVKKVAAAVADCEAGLAKLDPKSEAAGDARRLIERTRAFAPPDSP